MNKKIFVPFETAKLLKEKGYPQIGTEHYYNINGDMVVFSDDYEGYTEDIIMRIEHVFYASPTYHEVLDWLEKKGYPVESACIRDFAEHDIMWVCGCDIHVSGIYPTLEEALNDVILDLLNML